MNYLQVKNWSQFQHYNDRNPPWIKLHRALLDDYEFSRLQDASKAHLMLIWLFASQNGGRVPEDPKFLQTKLGLDKQPDLNSLVEQGFLLPEQTASSPPAERKQDASEVIAFARSREKRREETEKILALFERFWIAYPRKVAKQEALKAWRKIAPTAEQVDRMLGALELAKQRWSDPQYIPHPATWLRGERWTDEQAQASAPLKVAMP